MQHRTLNPKDDLVVCRICSVDVVVSGMSAQMGNVIERNQQFVFVPFKQSEGNSQLVWLELRYLKIPSVRSKKN